LPDLLRFATQKVSKFRDELICKLVYSIAVSSTRLLNSPNKKGCQICYDLQPKKFLNFVMS